MIEKVKSRFGQFKEGFYRGIGWSFGVTVGFLILSSLGVIILRLAGGLPLAGSIIADMVESTQIQLESRNLVAPR